VDPVPDPTQKNPKECPGIEPGTSEFVVFNANHWTTEAVNHEPQRDKNIFLYIFKFNPLKHNGKYK
jgi:hypothetical protein